MSFVGYKGTAPPKIFISFNRDELEGDFLSTNYSDPFELNDHFLSWTYSFGGKQTATGKLELINPSTTLEEKLFSWYAAIAPHSWRATQENYTTDELVSKVQDRSNFYIKWGYQAPKDHAIPNSTEDYLPDAFSKVHKFTLQKMSYRISDKQEKIVVLEFVNPYEMTYGDREFTSRELVYTLDLVDEDYKVRRPSLVIQ